MYSLANRNINVIAESCSSHTDWVLLENDKIIEQAVTVGLNPYFLSRREMSHIIRLELPKVFFRRRWNHVYFYGAGCSNIEKNKVVELSLVAQFKTPVTVMSDLMGAARGLFVHGAGIACVLGTGSNSCLYVDGDIKRNVRPLGFILGDEGSGSALGRIFLGDALKGLAPKKLVEAFFEHFELTPDEIMDSVYNNPRANTNLTEYSFFLSDHLDDEYVVNLVTNEFARFFERNVCQYDDYDRQPVSFAGTVATAYTDLLIEVASRYGIQIQKIVGRSMPGLVTYHSTEIGKF